MINSFENVDTEKLNNSINNYKEVLSNSSKRNYLDEINNSNVLVGGAKDYFVKSFEEINNMKKDLNKSLDIYRKLVEVVKNHKIESKSLKELLERKKMLESDTINDNTYELTQLNSEIENLSNQI